jgi:hypothetical protein
MVAKQPQDRPQSMREVIRELEACGYSAQPARPLISPPPSNGGDKRAKLRRWVIVSAAVVLLATFAFGLVVILRTRDGTLVVDLNQPDVPLETSVDILVYRNGPDSPPLSLKKNSAAAPLLATDKIGVRVTANRPGYLYLIWIDSNGKAFPVFPWDPGDWEKRVGTEPAREIDDLPGAPWDLTGPEGMETLVLLARDTPLTPAEEAEVKKRLAGLPKQSIGRVRTPVAFVDGEPRLLAGTDRGPNFSRPRSPDGPVFTTQRRIQEQLKPFFAHIEAISTPSQGTEKEP